jgi:hypothetical protein
LVGAHAAMLGKGASEISGTASSVTGGASAVFNFPTKTGPNVPYLQAGLGFGSNSGGGSFVGAGVRVLFGNSASINIAVLYERTSIKVGGTSVDEDEFNLSAGLSVFPVGFGSK